MRIFNEHFLNLSRIRGRGCCRKVLISMFLNLSSRSRNHNEKTLLAYFKLSIKFAIFGNKLIRVAAIQ